jgi:uncharacterized membrane protein
MRFFGYPIHPMLVHFPVVFWTVAAAAYVAGAADVIEPADVVAKFANGAGLTMAMLVMLAGLFELRSIDSRSEAMRVATWHMMIMATVWVCFLVALMLSISTGLGRPTTQIATVACAVAGFLLMGVGGWLGGRLAYEFGVAVTERTKS